MTHRDFGGVHVEADFDVTDEELGRYVARYDADEGRKLTSLMLRLVSEEDGEYVDVEARYARVPFNRISRITGYLTSDVRRWNDAKRAERRDRTLHAGSRFGQNAYLD